MPPKESSNRPSGANIRYEAELWLMEAMARALFQSWFVDFDPVRPKAEGRAPALSKTAKFLSGHILNKDYHMTYLPMTFSDQFEYIDRPLIATENINKLRASWKTHEDETHAWSSWTLTELLSADLCVKDAERVAGRHT